MPSRPLGPCLWSAGCPGLGTHRGYCDTHAPLAQARRRGQYRAYDATRVSPTERGLDAAWRKLRAQVIEETGGMCEDGCGRPGRDLHHVIPWAQGGANTRENVRLLCHPCHSRREAAARRR